MIRLLALLIPFCFVCGCKEESLTSFQKPVSEVSDHPKETAKPESSESDDKIGILRLVSEVGEDLGTFSAKKLKEFEPKFMIRIVNADLESFSEVTKKNRNRPIEFFWNGKSVAKASIREELSSGVISLPTQQDVLTTDDWNEARDHILDVFKKE